MGQASASKIRRRVREREQVARFIAETQRPGDVKLSTQALLGLVNARANGVDLTVFDVHAAREAAEAMLRKAAEALDVEQVFVDWTRFRGKGPENRVAFWRTAWTCGGCGAACAKGDDHRPCQRCGIEPLDWFEREVFGGWPGDLARHPDNPSPSWTPMARARTRLARRVLAALEGQPSECPSATCKPARIQDRDNPGCLMCHGTGHNLRGVLPPALEVSPQLRRRYFDSLHAAQLIDPGARDGRVDIAQWMRGLQWSWIDPGSSYRTRVAPRGEHHFGPARGSDDPPWTLDQRINGRGWAPESKRAAAEDMRLIFACSPAWRRGEVRAHETRARRAWEAVGEEFEGQSWMPPRAANGPEAAE